MASGKKGKKNKGKTLNLNEFLADENGAPASGQAVLIAPRKTMSWADEVENEENTVYESRRDKVVLPTAPRASRGSNVDDERVPEHPPFLAYMSNLPYDLEEADLAEFFGKLKIVKFRLPKDDRDPGKLKGFGYVEFEERNDLKEALGMNDSSLKNRRIRIEVSDNDGRRGGQRDRESSDRNTMTDWRSGGRDDNDRRSERNDERSFSGRRDYGGYNRDRERGGFGDRGGSDRSTGGTWERLRGGPEPERTYDRGFERGDRGFSERGQDRGGFSNDRYEGRSNYSSDRFGERRGGSSNYSNRRGYDDRQENRSGEPEPAKERPKLNLAPRTLPRPEEAVEQPKKEESASAPAPVSNPSIFGGAKPVDTLTRELEIEERLAKERAAQAEKAAAQAPKASEEAEKTAPQPSQTSWRSERGPPRHTVSSFKKTDGPRSAPQHSGPRDDRQNKGNRTDDRPPRKDDNRSKRHDDAPVRMPKMEEHQAPDFSQSNLYAALSDEDGECE